MGATFLKLIDKHFPKTNPLHKVINRKNTKVSYRTTSNIQKIISSHNQKVIRSSETSVDKSLCNCRSKPKCPLGGKCLVDNLVYQAEVVTDKETQTYVGLASTTFKLRYGNHKESFNNETSKSKSTLSKHIWALKNKGVNYETKFKIIGRAQPFSLSLGICNLCTLEKFHILFMPHLATLNKRDEINNFCLHRIPKLLDKT